MCTLVHELRRVHLVIDKCFNEFLKDPSEFKFVMSSGSLLNIAGPEQSKE